MQTSFYSDSIEVVQFDKLKYNGAKKTTSSLNSVITAQIDSFENVIRSRGLGIKYVAEGKESYWVGNKSVPVISGQYLLINESIPSVDVVIKNCLTSSVCLDIDPVLVNDVLLQILRPDDLENYRDIKNYLLTPDILVRQVQGSTEFQNLLNLFLFPGKIFSNDTFKIELLYELTSVLIKDNLDPIKSFYKIGVAKSSTRKELYSRLLLGREMLHEGMFTKTSISDIAQACCISEFRFYRLFKQCFGMSPYDYYLKLKLEKSLDLRRQGNSWEEISYLLNFHDLPAFNKAFKKSYGSSPSVADKQSLCM